MKREPHAKVATPTETTLEGRASLLKSIRATLPIDDPFLNGVSELLHRITDAESLEVARWYAGDALTLLRNYVTQQQGTASRNA